MDVAVVVAEVVVAEAVRKAPNPRPAATRTRRRTAIS